MRIASRLYYPAVIVILLFSAVAAGAADQTIVLKAARMFDGKSKALTQNGVVIVQGDKIVDVGSNVAIPSDAKVIDLGDMTLSPGFMDAHTHLTLDFSGDFNKRRLEQLDLNVSEQAIRAVGYARRTVGMRAERWKRVSQPCATWAAVLLAAVNLSMLRCVMLSIKA